MIVLKPRSYVGRVARIVAPRGFCRAGKQCATDVAVVVVIVCITGLSLTYGRRHSDGERANSMDMHARVVRTVTSKFQQRRVGRRNNRIYRPDGRPGLRQVQRLNRHEVFGGESKVIYRSARGEELGTLCLLRSYG